MDPAASARSGQAPGPSGANAGPAGPADARSRYKLLGDCRELVLSRLGVVVTGALAAIGSGLADEAVGLEKGERKRCLLDAVLMLRQNRRASEQAFRRIFGNLFEHRLFSPVDAATARRGDAKPSASGPVVARLAAKAAAAVGADETLGVRVRLAALLERVPFEEADHPVAPLLILEALNQALSEASPLANGPIDPAVREIVLTAFEPHLERELGAIYRALDTLLVTNRVLPSAAAVALAIAGPAAPAAPSKGRPVPPAVSSPVLRRFDALQQALRGIDQQGLRGDAVRMLADPGMFGVADLPVEPVDPMLLRALAEAQPRSADAGLPTVLMPQLVGRARELGTPLDRMTVELVATVFDYVQADESLAATVKSQLMRLQVVAVKSALIDRSFFARRQHPMRQLIDLTTQLAADPDVDLATDGPLLQGLGRVFDALIVDVDQQLDAFEPALRRIEQLRQEEATRRAAALASQLARAEIEEASALVIDRARSDIKDRIDESVPSFVREFLLRWWTMAIGRARLDAASTTNPTDDPMLRVAEQLIWSVAPKHPEEIGRLAGLLPPLIAALARGCAAVAMPTDEREAFMQELLGAHGAVIDRAKRWQVGQPDPRPAWMRLRSDGSVRFSRMPRDSATDPVTVAAGESVLGLFERGDHIELSQESGEAAVYKLAWISPARKLFILSRYPKDTLSLSAAQLATLVFNERARRLEGPQAVDDAIGVLAREAVNARKPSHGLPG